MSCNKKNTHICDKCKKEMTLGRDIYVPITLYTGETFQYRNNKLYICKDCKTIDISEDDIKEMKEEIVESEAIKKLEENHRRYYR